MRQPKPFFRKQTKSWYLQVGKRQICLGRVKLDAWEKYHELMSSSKDLNEQITVVVQLLDFYLDWCQKRRAKGTYDKSRHYCLSFLECIGRRLHIRQLKPKHITAWMDLHPGWSSSSRNDAISIIQRAFNWAVKQGHIDRSPISSVEDKPRRTRREVVYTREQFQSILNQVTDDIFRNLLEFLWETGCRPAEARAIEFKHLDLEKRLVLLPEFLNKTKKGNRVIFLNDRALAVLEQQLKIAQPNGTIFRNRLGNAWTKDAIKCRLERIKKKLGLDRLCAYGIRHSFATEGLKNNVDPISLSVLMGHSDASMIARTYQHLAKNQTFLLEQANRATGV